MALGIEHGRTGPLRRVAWITIAVVELAVVGWGLLALVDPTVLTAGFETSTGEEWQVFAAREAAAADVVLVGFRLVGALNATIGLLLLAVTVLGLRRGQRWCWWTLLVGNTLAFGAPILYDRVVGFVGVFEVLEYVALVVVYVALAVMWRRPPDVDDGGVPALDVDVSRGAVR